MALLWTITDQQDINAISNNRIGEFEMIAEEVQVKDLQDLLGYEFYQDIIQNPAEEWNAKLIAGGTFTDTAGETRTYAGLKFVLSYFFYARYIAQSDEKDTFTGMRRQNISDSEPLSTGRIKTRVNENRQIAYSYWKECELFIIKNVSHFEFYKYGDNVNIRFNKCIKYL